MAGRGGGDGGGGGGGGRSGGFEMVDKLLWVEMSPKVVFNVA